MRGRITAAVAATVLVLVGLTGCGIPSETGVQVEGAGPARGDGAVGGPRGVPPERLESGDDPKTFVANFLMAAAGEISGAYDRVKAYIAPERRGALLEKHGHDLGVNIVRLNGPIVANHRDNGTSEVIINVQHIGVLGSNGAVGPPELTDTSYTFEVGKIGVAAAEAGPGADRPADSTLAESALSPGLYLLRRPAALLMSEEALADYYERRTIYFWSKDRTALVSDSRHLPLAVPEPRRADEVVGWLTRGPADWLTDAVAALPAGTQKISNVTESDGRLVVNLSIELSSDQASVLDQLGTQLAWSLGQDHPVQLELKIKDESREVIDTALRRRDSPAYRVADTPRWFAVYAGKVHPIKRSGDTPPATVPLADSVNRNIVSAAFSRLDDGPVSAALVTRAGADQQLLVGSGVEVVAETTRGDATHARISRPVWLRSAVPSDPAGLVVADGKLYRFGLDATLMPVELPGATGEVTAVAASLDGQRIAFIADGTLYVAALTVTRKTVKAHPARQVPSSLVRLAAVEWVGEGRLVVAGVAGDEQVALYDINDDGTGERPRWSQRGTAEITYLTTYPDNPGRVDAVRVSYEANGVVWDELTRERVEARDIEGATNTSPDHKASSPTAPFFVY